MAIVETSPGPPDEPTCVVTVLHNEAATVAGGMGALPTVRPPALAGSARNRERPDRSRRRCRVVPRGWLQGFRARPRLGTQRRKCRRYGVFTAISRHDDPGRSRGRRVHGSRAGVGTCGPPARRTDVTGCPWPMRAYQAEALDDEGSRQSDYFHVPVDVLHPNSPFIASKHCQTDNIRIVLGPPHVTYVSVRRPVPGRPGSGASGEMPEADGRTRGRPAERWFHKPRPMSSAAVDQTVTAAAVIVRAHRRSSACGQGAITRDCR